MTETQSADSPDFFTSADLTSIASAAAAAAATGSGEPVVDKDTSRINRRRERGGGRFGTGGKPELLFLLQAVVIVTIVITSAVNLSIGNENETLQQAFLALISSCLGVILPTPSVQLQYQQAVVHNNNNNNERRERSTRQPTEAISDTD